MVICIFLSDDLEAPLFVPFQSVFICFPHMSCDTPNAVQLYSLGCYLLQKVCGDPVRTIWGKQANCGDVEVRGGQYAASDCTDQARLVHPRARSTIHRGWMPQSHERNAVKGFFHRLCEKDGRIRHGQRQCENPLERGYELLGKRREFDIVRQWRR